MNELASKMKTEIFKIANYKALLLSKLVINILLIIATFILAFNQYPMSSLYILLFLNILPTIMKYALTDYAKRYGNKLLTSLVEDYPFHLNQLKRRYRYTKLNYIANSITYLICLMLICLWQINYYQNAYVIEIIAIFPISILTVGIVLRLIIFVIYRIKLPYDLSHNRS